MRFDVQFKQSRNSMDAVFSVSESVFRAEFEGFQKITEYNDADPYTGSYEVIPKVDAQTLPTAQKFMADDVRIREIPMFEVSNTDGGETVYIGTEVDIYGD